MIHLESSKYFGSEYFDRGIEMENVIMAILTREILMKLQDSYSSRHRFKEQVRECGGFLVRVSVQPYRLGPEEPKGEELEAICPECGKPMVADGLNEWICVDIDCWTAAMHKGLKKGKDA